MPDLSQKKGASSKRGAPLKGPELAARARQLGAGWRVVDGHHLEREYPFADFREALAFTNKVGALAESQNHHPDIHLAWGRVKLVLWTHQVKGLTDNDFILAAKVDHLAATP